MVTGSGGVAFGFPWGAFFGRGFFFGFTLASAACVPPRDSQVGAPAVFGEFPNQDILKLDHHVTSLVDLGSNEAIEWNIGIGLGVIGSLDAVDPNLDTRSLGEDAIVIPSESIDPF